MDKGKRKQRSTRGRGKIAADGRSGQQASQTAIWVRDFQGPQRTKKPPPTYLSRATERERERERETSFSWLRVVRVEEVSTDLGLPNTFFNMMLMLLPTTAARKRAEFRSSKIQIRAEQLQCFNLQKSCPQDNKRKMMKKKTKKKKKKRRWVGGWVGSNEGNRERDTHTLTMLELLAAQPHKTSAIRAKWQLSWIALSSHTSNLLRLFPNTTTGGAYPGLGVLRVFHLGFWGGGGVGIIPSGSWYSNIGKRTTAVPGI